MKRPPSRFHRSPGETGPPYGWADLPGRFAGELADPDSLEPTFVPRSPCAHDLEQLYRPWRGKHAHPRMALARIVLADTTLELELGLRAAYDATDEYALTNALHEAEHRYELTLDAAESPTTASSTV